MGFDALQVRSFLHHLLVLRLAGDDPRQGENSDCDYNQQADDHAESIEKMGVLLAHIWIRVERLVNRRGSIDHPGKLRARAAPMPGERFQAGCQATLLLPWSAC